MIAFFLALIFFPKNQNDPSLTISNNVNSIFRYFEEEEELLHKSIMLYSSMSHKEFENTLKLIQEEIPHILIRYTPLDKSNKQACQISNCELSIVIPNNIISFRLGNFQYSFQSHVKNIFGTMTGELVLESNNFVIKHKQFFTTSIGE